MMTRCNWIQLGNIVARKWPILKLLYWVKIKNWSRHWFRTCRTQVLELMSILVAATLRISLFLITIRLKRELSVMSRGQRGHPDLKHPVLETISHLVISDTSQSLRVTDKTPTQSVINYRKFMARSQVCTWDKISERRNNLLAVWSKTKSRTRTKK